MVEREENDAVLELVPDDDRLLPSLKALTAMIFGVSLPLYRMRREPTHLNDLKCHADVVTGAGIMILCEKYGVFLYITENFSYQLKKFLCFRIYDEARGKFTIFAIVGSDQAVAETATFIWSLKLSNNSSSSTLDVRLPKTNCLFDFDALQPEQLARALDANPERHYCFKFGTLSPEQSVVLATRAYPLNIELSDVRFKDEGTAFVDALEKRQEPTFGSFAFDSDDQEVPISPSNLQRLFNLEITFDALRICQLDQECAHLPFAARANSIGYEFDISKLRPSDFDGMNIFAKHLYLEVSEDASFDSPDWGECLALLLDRMAECGHLETLSLSVRISNFGYSRFDSSDLVEALIRVINANSKLEHLDLGDLRQLFAWYDWYDYSSDIFRAMESHPGLRTFIFDTIGPYAHDSGDDDSFHKEHCDDVYDSLEQLLTRNRFITVYDDNGRCSNGGSIDKVYLRNDFFNGSEKLVTDSTPERPLLVATSLVESASHNFPFSAWLLSHHPDVLCELFHGTGPEEIVPALQETVLPTSMPPVESVDSKRRLSEPLPRATKKAAQDSRMRS
ncbi:hypothetical protein FisN_18Lh100 [Fistulifera solaris]|uniref:Uncharacterized protein n=1 Tax=Fistulifera solaris TaxID=1519565 RepID=A0A1Z5KEZ9_FISSO|nr:hypothetical protein FisN_18Lh100 [Fistulifera solaris]|eukprot:GAX24819.1 hypothetical protein FisN_18Lh100 [Fistulifera solaris]